MAIDPIRPTDDEARALARRLVATAATAALAVILPDGMPQVSRIAFGRDGAGRPLTLVSDLAQHARAIAADPRVSLMVGEPGARGDPLIHPRLTIQARALPVPEPERPELARIWLADHPKAQLYIGFADFRFLRFQVLGALLNGGFGKAFRLTPADLGLADPGS